MMHPGLQHMMRMKEMAELLGHANMEVIVSAERVSDTEKKLILLKCDLHKAETARGKLLELHTRLVTIMTHTQFGLPTGMTHESYNEITGLHIER